MLIPETYLTTSQWNTTNTTSGGYLNSYMNKTTLVNVANKLKNVLGDHLIERNVLLSSSTDSNGFSNNYIWTTYYCTLMSVGQLNGTFAQYENKYDDGEANYKLPLFNYMSFGINYGFWLRGIFNRDAANAPWCVFNDNTIYGRATTASNGVRPLIYIR